MYSTMRNNMEIFRKQTVSQDYLRKMQTLFVFLLMMLSLTFSGNMYAQIENDRVKINDLLPAPEINLTKTASISGRFKKNSALEILEFDDAGELLGKKTRFFGSGSWTESLGLGASPVSGEFRNYQVITIDADGVRSEPLEIIYQFELVPPILTNGTVVQFERGQTRIEIATDENGFSKSSYIGLFSFDGYIGCDFSLVQSALPCFLDTSPDGRTLYLNSANGFDQDEYFSESYT